MPWHLVFQEDVDSTYCEAPAPPKKKGGFAALKGTGSGDFCLEEGTCPAKVPSTWQSQCEQSWETELNRMVLAQIKATSAIDLDDDDDDFEDEELKAKLEAGRKRAAELKKMIE
mmetsp:Transcript_33580/g.39485  ORF Transcript_33580/g.39485 Transcript_33580/m.39485 type:complete len:114 (+) Transcript_33580:208-549(+)